MAREFIGIVLTAGGVGGPIVETESYDPFDPASHTFGHRQTPRNAVMFGAPGFAYVYLSYGMHRCLNFTCGDGAAVLIRALEPQLGIAKMQRRRGGDVDSRKLCAGPGRLCQALGIDGAMNGASLFNLPFTLKRGAEPDAISTGVRIGITKAPEAIRRYGLAQSPFLSRRFVD